MSTPELELELKDLLRAVDDLDAEHAAGDLDSADYQALRDSYTVRVADAMRRLGGDEGGSSASTAPRSGQAPRPGKAAKSDAAASADDDAANGMFTPRGKKILLATVSGLAFAVVAGLLLAQAAGERRVGDILTGNIQSPRQQVLDCQELGGQGDIVAALECFDDVLINNPDNAEALAYRGWFVVLTTGSAQQAGEEEAAAELLSIGRTYLDRAVEADPRLPDARAFRAAVFDRLGDSEAACADVDALLALDPPPFFVQQTAGIVERNGCESAASGE